MAFFAAATAAEVEMLESFVLFNICAETAKRWKESPLNKMAYSQSK